MDRYPCKERVRVGPMPGGATQSRKRYQLRSDLLGAVAVATPHDSKKGGCPMIISTKRGGCHSLGC